MSPHHDLFAPLRWRESLRRLRGRTLVLAAVATLAAFSGAAAIDTAGSVAQASSGTTLKVGSRGAAVKKLQRRLHVSVTGYYGSQTKAAVKRFQRANGLKADGVAGPATLRALGVTAHSATAEGTGGSSPSEGGSGSSGGGGGSSVHVPATLRRIAQCESGGNPRAISPGGKYRGKYQFDQATWERWGGTGDPAKASESRQDRIAVKLYKARGTAPWPNCGKAAS
jgi:peptidoglycan hydrolase-like protein with peptidoglycan-binding domain